MIKILIFLGCIALIISLIILIIKLIITKQKLKEYFKNSSVIVFGAKGKGKDLLFQKMILMNKKKDYYSNISYGYKYHNINIKDMSVEPNTYENFINDNIEKITLNKEMENKDIYISDGGVYLPSTYDYLLNKKFPSLPIFYALSRHLYNNNIHVNTQYLGRIWKALREQADRYIRCNGVIKLPFVLLVKIRMYDKYESAMNNLLPLSTSLLNKYDKAMVKQYNATNGEIYNGIIAIRRRNIKYDTRAFKRVLSEE